MFFDCIKNEYVIKIAMQEDMDSALWKIAGLTLQRRQEGGQIGHMGVQKQQEETCGVLPA